MLASCMIDDRFKFAKTEPAVRFCNRIIDAMTSHSDLHRDECVRMVCDYWSDVDDLEADPLLYGEPAYYYAMTIIHHPTIGDNKPEWFRDRSLWPPPPGWCSD
ncbi:MAG: hypothetical protein NXI28_27690 [bacterium]|nr:hypothetical protein [bacterium]